MSHRIDKRDECVKAIRHLDLQGKSPEEILMLAWMDGWEHALDLCIKLEQAIDHNTFDARPEFTDGRS